VRPPTALRSAYGCKRDPPPTHFGCALVDCAAPPLHSTVHDLPSPSIQPGCASRPALKLTIVVGPMHTKTVLTPPGSTAPASAADGLHHFRHQTSPQHGCAAVQGSVGHPGWVPGSYRDSQLGGVASPVVQDASDAIPPKQNRCPGYRSGLASSPSPTLQSVGDLNEGWQVVRPHRVRCCASSAVPMLHSHHYLTAVEGRCLNCLSPSHRRADHHVPTHCFNCHGFLHHLRDCKHPQKSPAFLGASEAACDTYSPLRGRGKGTYRAPELASYDASSFFEPNLVLPVSSVCFIPRSWDPMVEDVALGASVGALFHSCQEDAVGMVEQLANTPPSVMSPCLSNLLPSVEDIHTLVLFKSEDEQLVGHELIKALRSFKLSMVSSLSPSTSSCHQSFSNNETIVVHLKEIQSFYPRRKVKFKSMKSGFKVICNLLTKKWIVVKKNRHLHNLFQMSLLLKTLGVPL
jgi:hypothetical protein